MYVPKSLNSCSEAHQDGRVDLNIDDKCPY